MKVNKKKSIGEAAREVGIQEHVLRFWETQFPTIIIPTIGNGSRRYYFDEDLKKIITIKDYLHNQGYTIKGLQNLIQKEEIFKSKKVNTAVEFEKIEIKNVLDNSQPKKKSDLLKNKLYNFQELLNNFNNKLEVLI